MFLMDAIKQNVEKKLETFWRLLMGGESQAYKIKPVLFLFVLCFLAATKTLFKTKEENIMKRKENNAICLK